MSQSTPVERKTDILTAIGGGLVFACLIGWQVAACFPKQEPVRPYVPVAVTAPAPAPLPNGGLSVIDKSAVLERDGDRIVRVTGLVANDTEETKRTVMVQYNIYDTDGVLIGSAMDCVSHLEAKGIWKFTASTLIEENGRRPAVAKLMELSSLQ